MMNPRADEVWASKSMRGSWGNLRFSLRVAYYTTQHDIDVSLMLRVRVDENLQALRT